VVGLSENTHLVKAGTAFERNPLTISEKSNELYILKRESLINEKLGM
jgi:hypothetical protein